MERRRKSQGPAVRARELARRLCELREQSGLSAAEAAEALQCDRTYINHLEKARRIPGYPALVVLLQAYGAVDQLKELAGIREEAHIRGWWDITGLSSPTKTYLGLENDASLSRSFAQELVPGLVQRPAYATEIERLHGTDDEKIKRAVSTRLLRQGRIGDGLTVEVVVSEGLLWRTLAMGESGVDQLRYLRDTADDPSIQVSVLEFASAAHRGMTGSFSILDFPEGSGEMACYVTYAHGANLVDNPVVTSGLVDLFNEVRGIALGVAESTAMTAVMREMGTR